tara:strand:+ start:891 stop:1214 length:324 start_codon:yes stop_codon:yes gene_type:complete
MIVVVMVAIPQDKARELATALLNERVCACVNIIDGVESLFWWKGKIDTAKESILLIKTRETLFTKLQMLIKDNHPYEVPEISSIKIDEASKEYKDWLNQEANAQPYL